MPTQKKSENKGASGKKPVRYAVVGLGYFAQAAILPAFEHCKNGKLTALVSDDPEKLKKLGHKYGVKNLYSYDQYQECLGNGEVDAVYIALPNDMHREYTVRAAKMGIHVLCEKPMAVSTRDCEEMIREASEHHVRLMIAYRLHMDEANLKAIEIATSGKIGEPRLFNSVFAMQVKDQNIRIKGERGGGTLYDLGVYCINAARYLFQDEPYEVTAFSASKHGDARFSEVDEMTSAILRFPGDRLASFTTSFGAADVSSLRVVGTQGDICAEPAFDYSEPIQMWVTTEGKTKEMKFPKRDQIAGEIEYFSDCVLQGKEPEPNGLEGLADVRVVQALYESAMQGKPIRLERLEKKTRPTLSQVMKKPASGKPQLIHADSPSSD
jgi:predicted dehydrogenase